MRSHKNIKPIFLSVLIIIAIVIILPLLFQSRTKQIVADGSRDQGLSFTITEISPTGAAVEYVQKKGDIKGALMIESFGIYLQEDYQYVLEVNKSALLQNISLQQNSSGSFTIDFCKAYDPLKPGKYYLKLSVYDSVDDTMNPIYDHESYYIPFALP